MVKKHLKPQFYDDDEDLDSYLRKEDLVDQNSDDEIETLSFGSLKTAQDKLDKLEKKEKPVKNRPLSERRIQENLKKERKEQRLVKEKALLPKKVNKKKQHEDEFTDDSDKEQNDIQSDNDSEGGFFDNESDSEEDSTPEETNYNGKKKQGKHAPKEASSKRPVKKLRDIPGLEGNKSSTLFTDIRFDTAFGKADLERVRKDYKFLDDYRESEIKDIKKILKNPKIKDRLSNSEVTELEYEQKSLKSRLDSLKNKEMQKKAIEEYKQKMNTGSGNKYYLKKSEERKIVQKYKFDHMKSKQREKVMERKRKRRLGKEFKQLEFNKPRN